MKSGTIIFRMNRPVKEEELCLLSPGGFYVQDNNGAEHGFDFLDTAGEISKEAPCKVIYRMENPDLESFPGMTNIRVPVMIKSSECYMYSYKDDLFPERIILFSITGDDNAIYEFPGKFLDGTQFPG